MDPSHIDAFNAPISTSDAAQMFKRNAHKNSPPYTSEIVRCNNALVSRWKTEVLDEVADAKCRVPTGMVAKSWGLFEEGRTIEIFKDLYDRDLIETPSDRAVEFWINFFTESTIEDMHALGTGCVSQGWSLLMNHLKITSASEQYERFFSIYTTPLERQRHVTEYDEMIRNLPDVIDKETLADCAEKVRTVLHNVVEPQRPGH